MWSEQPLSTGCPYAFSIFRHTQTSSIVSLPFLSIVPKPGYAFGKEKVTFLLRKMVSNAPKRLDPVRTGQCFQLRAQTRHVHFERGGAHQHILAGQCIEQGRSRHRPVARLHQGGQDLCFNGRQPNRLAAMPCLVLNEGKIVIPERLFARGVDRPQMDANAGDELLQFERLGHVVDSALKQQLDFVVEIALGAQHHHGNRPDGGQHILAGQSGKHQIQHDEVDRPALKDEERLAARIRPPGGESFVFERGFDHVANVFVVFDDQYRFHGFIVYRTTPACLTFFQPPHCMLVLFWLS